MRDQQTTPPTIVGGTANPNSLLKWERRGDFGALHASSVRNIYGIR
jgi:hypothetical protein